MGGLDGNVVSDAAQGSVSSTGDTAEAPPRFAPGPDRRGNCISNRAAQFCSWKPGKGALPLSRSPVLPLAPDRTESSRATERLLSGQRSHVRLPGLDRTGPVAGRGWRGGNFLGTPQYVSLRNGDPAGAQPSSIPIHPDLFSHAVVDMATLDPGDEGFSTQCVWSGDPASSPDGAAVPPIYHTVTFEYDDLDTWQAVGAGEEPGHIYSRNTNPTVEAFEKKMRVLEGAEAATSFATGMAAVSNTLLSLLSPGDRAVSITDTYGGTNKIFNDTLPRFDVEVVLCETDDPEAIERAIDEGCEVLYLESPTNPTLKIVDLRRLARAAEDVGATVIVDNTFATPVNQRPLALGADLVLHSATKFLGGHSDVMGGVVCGPEDLIETIFQFREIHGASLAPKSAALLTRGLKTLALRVERHNENARRVADVLDSHPAVEQVFYPGRPDHRFHDVARRQMDGFGGILSFTLRGGFGSVRRLLENLQRAHRAASLGSVHTLVGPPATTSHVELSPEERAAAGIPESLVRYSTGIENAPDLIADLRRGLERVEAHLEGAGT